MVVYNNIYYTFVKFCGKLTNYIKMSLPQHRQQIILDALNANQTLTIRELAEQLNVSTMTIHRDLDRLADDGLVQKIHGGVTLPLPLNAEAVKNDQSCHMCSRAIKPQLAYAIMHPDGSQTQACCPHCGLLMQRNDQENVMALATDFIYGHTTNARWAIYLVGSSVTVCCSPSVLAFSSHQDAVRFQQGFGGELMDFEQARQHLHATHSGPMRPGLASTKKE